MPYKLRFLSPKKELICLTLTPSKLALWGSRSCRKEIFHMGGDASYNPVSSLDSLEDELIVEDYEHFSAAGVRSPPIPTQPVWAIDADDLKMMHRVGRGTFGDVWLCTLHNSTTEFDEFHEVAVKVLPTLSEDQAKALYRKFETLFQASQGLKGVSWPRGISTKNGKVCIVTTFYEGSVGDKMARHPENRIPLADVLRYGADIARGMVELHSRGVIALNLKPCNLLVDDQDTAIVGEFGTPLLFPGSVPSTSETTIWLGTPNYMAPEQWGAVVRGPISFETDSWGFACSIVEMITGTRPWDKLTVEDIFNAVVVRHEKPPIPSGLPVAIEKILRTCFEYDYRLRPAFEEIYRAFSSPEALFRVGDWVCVGRESTRRCKNVGVVKSVLNSEKLLIQFPDKPDQPVECSISSKLSFWKNPLHVGDVVRVKQDVPIPRFGWQGETAASEGLVVEISEKDATVLVNFPGSQAWRADPAEIERVSIGFAAGDWVSVRGGWCSVEHATDSIEVGNVVADDLENSTIPLGQNSPSRVGVVHNVEHDGKLKVAFFGRETLWTGNAANFKKIPAFTVGQAVRLKNSVRSPRFDWPVKPGGEWDTGRVCNVLPNGGLIVHFPRRMWNQKGWWADPEEVEVVRLSDISGLAKKYEFIESMHWAVRPIVSVLGFLVAARVGLVVFKVVLPRREDGNKGRVVAFQNEFNVQKVDTEKPQQKSPKKGSRNPSWLPLPPPVSHLIFGEAER